MNIKDHLDDDEYLEESDWETEIVLAVEDAKEWGLGFFIVFDDKTMARASFEEIYEVIEEWKKKVAKS